MQTNPEQWAVDVRYLAKLADWAAGEGFCKIEALTDPDEWCIDAYDRAYPGKDGEGYSADTLAAGLVASIQAAFAEREARNLSDTQRLDAIERAAEISFVLEWTAAPRPPVHPKPMVGQQVFATMEKVLTFFAKQPADATFGTLREVRKYTIDRTAATLAALKDRTQ